MCPLAKSLFVSASILAATFWQGIKITKRVFKCLMHMVVTVTHPLILTHGCDSGRQYVVNHKIALWSQYDMPKRLSIIDT